MTYVQPLLTLVLILMSAALLLLRRGRTAAASRCLVVAVGLVFLSWPPLTALLAATLEAGYPAALPRDIEAIVVLGANLHLPQPPHPPRMAGPASYLRCRCAAWLYKNAAPVPILASGGDGGGGISVASEMAHVLRTEGVDDSHLWLEDRSASTYQNALFSARILRQKGVRRIALVTESFHLPRATASFRKQGLEVTPVPCGFRSLWGWEWRDLLPNPRSLLTVEDTLREWLALAWYFTTGRL